MRAGTLRNRITIQQKTVAYDRFNCPIEGKAQWTEYARVWASFKRIKGSEYFVAKQLQNKEYMQVYIRYRTDINQKMRVVHESKIYNIESIMPSNKKDYLILMCSERSFEQEEDND